MTLVYNIGFIGNDYKTIEFLVRHPSFNIKHVLIEGKRVPSNLLATLDYYSLPYSYINSKKELSRKVNYDLDFYIMSSFGIIIPEKVINKIKIFNIHPGVLPEYKGRNPVVYQILKGELNPGISLHIINEKIDEGELISIKRVPLYLEECIIDLENKLTQQIPSLLEDLVKYLEGKIQSKKLKGGIYYPRVTPNAYTINLKKDNVFDILNKIRSQCKYQGAKLYWDNKIIWIKKVEPVLFNPKFYFVENNMVFKKRNKWRRKKIVGFYLASSEYFLKFIDYKISFRAKSQHILDCFFPFIKNQI